MLPVRVTVCGVRGSTPAPGAEYVRVGGHTSCIAVAHDGDAPTLVLDAGTGIRRVTKLLGGTAFHGSILLGHLHWDHTEGLPFFRAADRSESVVDLYVPGQGHVETTLARFMSPPHFPIGIHELRGTWRFFGLNPGEHEIEGFSVLALDIPHKGGRTFGYRIADGDAAITYMSDHCPTALGPGPHGLGEYHHAALRLTRGSRLLLHDSQYLDEEVRERGNFGHSACGYAVGLAETANAARLLMFHHDPGRTDDEVDSIVSSYADSPVSIEAACEDMIVDL